MSVIIRLQKLPWSANASDIREFFHGLQIPEGGVHIVGGRDGDAFIAFSSDEDARQAMRMDTKRLREVRVKLLLSSRVEMQKVIEKARGDYTAPDVDPAPTETRNSRSRSREREKEPHEPKRRRSRSPNSSVSYGGSGSARSLNVSGDGRGQRSPARADDPLLGSSSTGPRAGLVTGFNSFPGSFQKPLPTADGNRPFERDISRPRNEPVAGPPFDEPRRGSDFDRNRSFDNVGDQLRGLKDLPVPPLRDDRDRSGRDGQLFGIVDQGNDRIGDQRGGVNQPIGGRDDGFVWNPLERDYRDSGRPFLANPPMVGEKRMTPSMAGDNRMTPNNQPFGDGPGQTMSGGDMRPPMNDQRGGRQPINDDRRIGYQTEDRDWLRGGNQGRQYDDISAQNREADPYRNDRDAAFRRDDYGYRDRRDMDYPRNDRADPRDMGPVGMSNNSPWEFNRAPFGGDRDRGPIQSGGQFPEPDRSAGQIPGLNDLPIRSSNDLPSGPARGLRENIGNTDPYQSGAGYRGQFSEPPPRSLGRQDFDNPSGLGPPQDSMRQRDRDPLSDPLRPFETSMGRSDYGRDGDFRMDPSLQRIDQPPFTGGRNDFGPDRGGNDMAPRTQPPPVVQQQPPPSQAPVRQTIGPFRRGGALLATPPVNQSDDLKTKDADERGPPPPSGHRIDQRGPEPLQAPGKASESPMALLGSIFPPLAGLPPLPRLPGANFPGAPRMGMPPSLGTRPGPRPLLEAFSPPDLHKRGGPTGLMPTQGGPPPRQIEDECYAVASNLPRELHRYMTLRQWFRPLNLNSNDCVKMMFDGAGNNLGLAYIKFINPEECRVALQKDGLEGVRIRVSTKREFEDANDGPPPIQENRPRWSGGIGGSQDARGNRFVVELANVPYKAKPEELDQFFGRLRPIERRKYYSRDGLPTDRWFVEFRTFQEADECLRRRGEISTRNVITRPAEAKDLEEAIASEKYRDRQRDLPVRERIEDTRRRSRESRGNSRRRSRSRSRERRRERTPPKKEAPRPKSPVIKDVCVYLSGMPHTITERDIAGLLDGCRITPNGIRLMKQPVGTAYVELVDIQDCEKALKRDRAYMGSQSVSIKAVSKEIMQDAVAKQFTSGFGSTASNATGKVQPTNERPPARNVPAPAPSVNEAKQGRIHFEPPTEKPKVPTLAEQQAALGPPPGATPIDPEVVLGIGKPGCVVAVHGLPPKISLEELCQFFGGHEILDDSVRMHYNDAGDPTGDCLLAINTPEETIRAVAKLNGTNITGHTVRMYIVPVNPGGYAK